MKGLHFEHRGQRNYYKVILHIGTCYVPVSDDILEELKKHASLSSDQFLSLFIDKVGYSSYLKEQIHAQLTNGGDSAAQTNALQQFLRNLS